MTYAVNRAFATLLALLMLITMNRAFAAELSVLLEEPPSSGTIAMVLFDTANTFGDLRDPAKLETYTLDGRERYVIKDIPAGEYALMVYHDQNENQDIDKNFIGIPTEPLGFSNNYRPKGPPSYARAAFTLTQDEQRDFTIGMQKPLGERGRVGVGAGVIARSSPYRDYDGGVAQVIPAISYNGNRLQILGPTVSYGLVGTGKLRLAAAASYRLGVYEEDDSDFLEGLGDRDSTLMAGLALQAELPMGFDATFSYEHDVLDRIGGGEARVAIDNSFQFGSFRLSPVLGANWLAQDLVDYDFGVPENKARPDRPAYRPDSALTLDAGMGVLYEINTDWLVVMNLAVEFFDNEVTDSPIVEDDYVLKGFFAINYVF